MASYDFPIGAAISALRALMISEWALHADESVPESGNTPKVFDQDSQLPQGMIQSTGEWEIQDEGHGEAVKAIVETLNVRLWLVKETTSGQNALSSLRNDLIKMNKALIADRTLGKTVTTLNLTGNNWSGEGEAWIADVEEGSGVVAGYVAVRLVIIDA